MLGRLAWTVCLATYASLSHHEGTFWALLVPVTGAVASAGWLGPAQGGWGRSDHYCACLRPTLG